MPGTSSITESTVNHWQRALDLRRDQLHLRVSELARRAGLPRSTVHRILYTDLAHPPTSEQIRALCRPLRMQYEVTWIECLQAWYPDALLFAEMDADDVEVLGVARQLSKEDRRRLLRTAKAWLHDDNDT